MTNRIENIVLNVFDDDFLSHDELVNITALNGFVVCLAVDELIRKLKVFKFCGKYKRIACANDDEIKISMQLFVYCYIFNHYE